MPQNHLAVLDHLRLDGSEEQKRFFYGLVLDGVRFGNAFSERHSRTVAEFQTRVLADGDGFRVDGRKFYSSGALLAHWVPAVGLDAEHLAHLAFIPQFIQAAIDAGIARGILAETVQQVRRHARPWIDANQQHAWEDPYTIQQVGDLRIRVRAAEAVLDLAADAIEAALAAPDEESVAAASIAVAEAKVLTTEAALLAANRLFELAGTRSTLEELNLDRHWRNARTHTLHDPVRWKYHAIGNYQLNGVKPPRHAWL